MDEMENDRVFDILMQVRAGSTNTADATREEVEACVDAGLLEWTLPEGLRYTMTAAFHVGDRVPDFASLPKVHPVRLTALGLERVRARLLASPHQILSRSREPTWATRPQRSRDTGLAVRWHD